jgi:hypothetical protein
VLVGKGWMSLGNEKGWDVKEGAEHGSDGEALGGASVLIICIVA